MKDIIKELERELEGYKPRDELFFFYSNDPKIRRSPYNFRGNKFNNLKKLYGERAIDLSLLRKTPYGGYRELVIDDKNNLGIMYYEILKEGNIVAVCEYVYPYDYESAYPTEDRLEAYIENLLAFISKSSEDDIKKSLSIIRKYKTE
ncbi:MAG: hypothetical protein QXJ96_01090 [Candidatus Aenigmatarchaeota archaeon]|nr:hypothetical protein [Candidatus Aenigmarchaeota archaeon]